MAAPAECPNCGVPAPPPRSREGDRWMVRMAEGPGAIALCPDCAASPNARQLVEDQVKRNALSEEFTIDTVVFIRGEAKVLAECTGAEVKWLLDDIKQQEERAAAWVSWFEVHLAQACLLYTSPSPRDRTRSRMPSSA